MQRDVFFLVSAGDVPSVESGELCHMKLSDGKSESVYIGFAREEIGQQLIDGHPGKASFALRSFGGLTQEQIDLVTRQSVLFFVESTQVAQYLSDLREGNRFVLSNLVVPVETARNGGANAL